MHPSYHRALHAPCEQSVKNKNKQKKEQLCNQLPLPQHMESPVSYNKNNKNVVFSRTAAALFARLKKQVLQMKHQNDYLHRREYHVSTSLVFEDGEEKIIIGLFLRGRN